MEQELALWRKTMGSLGYGILDEPIVRKVRQAMEFHDKVIPVRVAGEEYRISRPLAIALYLDDGDMRLPNGTVKRIV